MILQAVSTPLWQDEMVVTISCYAIYSHDCARWQLFYFVENKTCNVTICCRLDPFDRDNVLQLFWCCLMLQYFKVQVHWFDTSKTTAFMYFFCWQVKLETQMYTPAYLLEKHCVSIAPHYLHSVSENSWERNIRLIYCIPLEHWCKRKRFVS